MARGCIAHWWQLNSSTSNVMPLSASTTAPWNSRTVCIMWTDILMGALCHTSVIQTRTSVIRTCVIVSSPDLIWRIYRFPLSYFSYWVILKAIRAGVGFGSGTETRQVTDNCSSDNFPIMLCEWSIHTNPSTSMFTLFFGFISCLAICIAISRLAIEPLLQE